ncbi:MAG: hypothetical protein NZ529_05865 [Cytophagaceae bacterium]|nr:hypothetical protein [Cytophagaceae bacterium]MDW8456304.1 hypothetical protein [Cytophagaceae bacterium]
MKARNLLFTILGLAIYPFAFTYGQQIKWEALNTEWTLNSAGYPAEDRTLDLLYYKLIGYKLIFEPNHMFKMHLPGGMLLEGTYEIDKSNYNITFFIPKENKKITYTISEFNEKHLVLIAPENSYWAFHLDLTSDKH